jgi:hypothetical protein
MTTERVAQDAAVPMEARHRRLDEGRVLGAPRRFGQNRLRVDEHAGLA